MEERGQGEDMGMPSSISMGYNQHDGREPATSSLISNAGERRDQNTVILPQDLDRLQVYPPPSHHFNQLDQAQRPRRDPDQNQDPGSAIASNCGAISTQIVGGSQSRPPTKQRTITTAAPNIRYRECLKNHAASIGTHVLDGCGEFMPSGGEETPEALQCAACDCHRNFHRKEVDGESQYAANSYYTRNLCGNTSKRDATAGPQLPAAIQTQTPLQQHHRYSHGLSMISPLTGPVPTMMMAFGGNGQAESTSEDLNMYQSSGGAQQSGQVAKKRVRTKFTQEQKNKMMEFCEKIGWKFQKQDDEQVQQFCSEIGVRRQVLKVWMHNNKQAMKRAIVRPNS